MNDNLILRGFSSVNEFVDEREGYDFGAVRYSNKDVEHAKKVADDHMRVIIHPTNNLRELEDIWTAFCMQSMDQREDSDNLSMQIFGVINQYHYELLRSEFLKQDIDSSEYTDDILDESTIVLSEDTTESISYTPIDIEEAIQWTKTNGRPMIYPTRTIEELESLWNNWNSYHLKIRRESDWKSIEIFGISNQAHYDYLKAQFLKNDIEKVDTAVVESFVGDPIIGHKTYDMDDSIPTYTRARDLLNLVSTNRGNYENVLTHDIVDKVTGEYRASNQNFKYDRIPFEDLPFFTPEEMIDFGVTSGNPEGNFYGCEPIANIVNEEWFTDYCNTCVGYYNNYNPIEWRDNVSKLFLQLKTCKPEENDPIKQSILNYGWPPEMEFSPENRVKAAKRIKSIYNVGSTQFVDLRDMVSGDEEIDEAVNDGILKPVFIVLEEGKTAFSAIIKKATDSVFSHAAISFDPELKEMYSYGMEGSEKGFIGGFIKEDIRQKDPKLHLGVFAIFLKKEDWQKLKDIVNDFVQNVKKTSYSYLNLIASFIFKIPVNRDYKLVCSQFVDKILKLIDIDLTHKDSSRVAPNDFEKVAKENKKIYTLFYDITSKFNPKRVKSVVNRLTKRAEPIKESYYITPMNMAHYLANNCKSLKKLQEMSMMVNESTMLDESVKKIYNTMLAPCLEAECYTEAKDFPVQFDKEGNLFIKNVKKRDYEGEYSKSHKLLRKYETVKNLDGIKYELCKLWMMNSIIEAKLHSKKFNNLPSAAIESSAEHKARAKILNDFNHYLEFVLKEEPTFNFEKYFQDSPFNDAMIKINRDTLIWSGELIKQLIKNIV